MLALFAPLLLASCCGDPRIPVAPPAPLSEMTFPDLTKDQELNASVRRVFTDGIRATFMRIAPFRAEDGDLVPGPLLGFEGRFYRVLGPETDVPAAASRIVCTDVEAALDHTEDYTLFCGFSPGLFVRFHRSVGGKDVLVGIGAICLECGEWHLQLRPAGDDGYGTLSGFLAHKAYDDIVDAAIATFPGDGALERIKKATP